MNDDEDKDDFVRPNYKKANENLALLAAAYQEGEEAFDRMFDQLFVGNETAQTFPTPPQPMSKWELWQTLKDKAMNILDQHEAAMDEVAAGYYLCDSAEVVMRLITLTPETGLKMLSNLYPNENLQQFANVDDYRLGNLGSRAHTEA